MNETIFSLVRLFKVMDSRYSLLITTYYFNYNTNNYLIYYNIKMLYLQAKK